MEEDIEIPDNVREVMKIENFKFRVTGISDGTKIDIYDAWRRVRTVELRNLNNNRCQRLISALRLIHAQLKPNNYLGVSKERLVFTARWAVFLRTKSKAVQIAYTGSAPEQVGMPVPIIIFSDGVLKRVSLDELSVTLLHELIHAIDIIDGRDFTDAERKGDSDVEAIHDAQCYDALGLNIPSTHLVFRKTHLWKNRNEGQQ